MKKIATTFAMGLALVASPVLAHHPSEGISPDEVFAMVDELVLDTPHATIVFDENMGSTEITVPSVSDAEEMIENYLLASLSLLEDVTLTITFDEQLETITSSVQSYNSNNWSEGEVNEDGWGKGVIITVDTLLCIPDEDFLPDVHPEGARCIDILDED